MRGSLYYIHTLLIILFCFNSNAQPNQITDSEFNEYHPKWSPDGSMIAFGSARSGNTDIWILSVNDGTVEQLTSNDAYDSHADWSPDGSKMAFASQRDGDFDVFVTDAPRPK